MPGKPSASQTAAMKAHADAELKRYRGKSPAEKRAIVAKRDPENLHAADKRHAAKPDVKAAKRGREAQDRTSGAHDQERRARKAVADLPKPTKCASCGKAGAVEWHHPDHSKPNAVKALCSSCNKKAG